MNCCQEAQDKEMLVVINAGEVEEFIEQMMVLKCNLAKFLGYGGASRAPPYPLAGGTPALTPYRIFPVSTTLFVSPNPPSLDQPTALDCHDEQR